MNTYIYTNEKPGNLQKLSYLPLETTSIVLRSLQTTKNKKILSLQKPKPMHTALLLWSICLFNFNNSDTLPSSGYYVGKEKIFIGILVKVENKKAIADFIWWEHFPRNLESDTLEFDSTKHVWIGKKTTIYQKGKHLHIQTTNSSLIFNGSINAKLKQREKYYLEHVDQYKNSALINYLFESYMIENKGNTNARKIYESIRQKYRLNILETYSEFLEKFKLFKAELDSTK